jgi:uncharacterized protein (TIGR03437 family)
MTFVALGLALAGMLCAATNGLAPASYTIETVAGSSAVGDNGPATSASLSDAEGVAVDSKGNVFIADANDHRVREIAPDGTITTVAGDGFPGFLGDGGPASASRLNTPYGVAVDRAGNLYIADLGNNRVRQVGPDGTITTVSGIDTLQAPRNVAVDAAGNLYISEFAGARVWRLGTDGAMAIVAGTGSPGFAGDGGPATSAQLAYPAGLAFDSSGNLYIADSSNNRVRKIAGGVITTALGTGSPGVTLPNQLNLPTGVAIDGAGDLDVADSGNQRIQQLTTAGAISTLPGAGRDLALDSAGDLIVAAGTQVLELTPALALQVIAGDGSYLFRGDGGPATSARLNGPVAIALDSAGVLYIADQRNMRLRAVASAGTISTLAGDGTAGAGNDELDAPAGVAVNSSGVVYIADQNNDRILAMMSPGNLVTVAGTGVPGFNGDGLPATATQLFSPGAMALASDGSLYFADIGNARVRELTTGQTIWTVEQLPARGVAVDGSGNIYATNGDLHEIVRIDAAGHATVIAGTGVAGFAGDGGPAGAAQLNSPGGLAVDKQGNLYISDTGNNSIRVIGSGGTIQTIAGTGTADFEGDGGPALSAALNAPTGLLVDASGNVWIADTGNNRVRELTPAAIASSQSTSPAIVNAASLLAGPVAPGEIVSVFGVGIGPVTAVGAALDASGVVETQLAATQVLFGGVAASLYYVQAGQINCQVPYEVAGQSTVDVEILYQGQSSGKVTVAVAPAAPGIFTVSAGTGVAAATNENGTVNSPVDPAPAGSVITLYATGEGITQPASADGTPSAAPFPQPVLPVTLTIGGTLAEILFAGEAPGFSGLLQINARVPASLAASTGSLPVTLRIGTASSQTGVMIEVP